MVFVGSSRSRLCFALICAITTGAACKTSAPTEPQPAVRPSTTQQAQRPSVYRPPLEESARRIAEAYARQRAEADAGAAGAPTNPRRLDVGGLDAVDVVAVRFESRWIVGAVERERVSIGLLGAERIHQLREDERRAISAAEMTRIVGALHYYPYAVWDGTSWTDNEPTPATATRTTGATPALTPRPQGGRDLTFSFFIPEGSSGAGNHLAHIRVTDSRLLIDMAPNPERR